jgi:protein-tyrosine phosphatase
MTTADSGLGGRTLRVPGTFNVRDLGGLPVEGGAVVRRGVLVRSAELSELEPAGAVLLAGLGLRTVVDLRTDEETGARPDHLTGIGAQWHGIPLLALAYDEIPAAQIELYGYMADFCTKETAQAVRALAAPGALPALFHCAVGKDRTGFLAAVILALIGVPDEEIVRDFLLSNPALGLPRQEQTDFAGLAGQSSTDEGWVAHPQLLASRNAISAELITEVLDRIRGRHGTISAYLRSGGVTEAELESLTAALVDHG